MQKFDVLEVFGKVAEFYHFRVVFSKGCLFSFQPYEARFLHLELLKFSPPFNVLVLGNDYKNLLHTKKV